jgi:hypothetical protein
VPLDRDSVKGLCERMMGSTGVGHINLARLVKKMAAASAPS